MKAIFFYPFVLLLLLTSCSPESKAKRSIEAYLKTTLNDPSSYEFVKMDELKVFNLTDWRQQQARLQLIDKGYDVNGGTGTLHLFGRAMREYQETQEYRKLDSKQKDNALKHIGKVIDSIYDEDTKRAYAGIADSKEADSKIVKSYSVNFTFRAKNKLGALGIETHNFTLDPSFNVLSASSK